MFVWKPSHTCGTARRKPSGLKKECRNLPISTPPQLTTSLLQDRNARERQPLRLQPRDRSIRLERFDRAVQRGLQLAALVHDRTVALVRDDLTDHTAVRPRLLLALRDDDRDVENERVAFPGLDRVERRRGRSGVDERLLRGAKLVLNV